MNPILHQTFPTLGFSKDFIKDARQHYFSTPAQMLKLSLFHLEALGLTRKALYEFITFLEKEKLADHINEF